MQTEENVGIPTRPENTATPNPSGKYRNAEQSEYRPLRKMPEHRTVEIPTLSETLEIQPERKMLGNLDIRKKGAGPIYRPDTKEDRAG
jgi:hypothetical protein